MAEAIKYTTTSVQIVRLVDHKLHFVFFMFF